jgi:hypothetical protein
MCGGSFATSWPFGSFGLSQKNGNNPPLGVECLPMRSPDGSTGVSTLFYFSGICNYHPRPIGSCKIIIHPFWRTAISLLTSNLPKQKPNDTIHPRIKIRGYKDLTALRSFQISVKPLFSLWLCVEKNISLRILCALRGFAVKKIPSNRFGEPSFPN